MRIQRLSQYLFFCFISIFFSAACAPEHLPELNGQLPINAPKIAQTGDQIDVTVGPVSAHNGTPVGLVMVGTYGPRVYNAVFESGMAHFTIPAAHTLQPGYLALIAASENARGEISIMLSSNGVSSIAYPSPGEIAGISTPNG